MACGISLYGCVFILLCVSTQVSGDITIEGTMLRFESRLSHLELVAYSMKASLSNINDRLDKMETKFLSQMRQTPNDILKVDILGGTTKKNKFGTTKRFEEAVMDGFKSEKRFLRATLTQFEGQFKELQNTIHDHIALVNTSMDESNRRFGQAIQKTEQHLDDLLELHSTKSDLKLQGIKQDVMEAGNAMRRSATEIKTVARQIDDVNNMVNNIETNMNKRVAFTVQLRKTMSKVAKNTIIVFETVSTNYGNGYSATTGKFTAPESGLYLFHFSVLAYNSEKAHVTLIIDGKVKATTNVSTGNSSSGSNAGLGYMAAGDEAYVRTANYEATFGISPYTTAFSGVLIK